MREETRAWEPLVVLLLMTAVLAVACWVKARWGSGAAAIGIMLGFLFYGAIAYAVDTLIIERKGSTPGDW